MSIKSMPVSSGANIHTTTKQRELLGWCGAMSWLFLMIYAYDIFILGTIGYFEGSWYQFFFMLLFALSIAVFGFCFGRNPDGLSKIAFYTTPIAIGITAALGVLPQPLCSVMYTLSPVFMAPAITRRVYGVIRTAELGNRLLRYAYGFSVSFVAFAAWLILSPPKEIAFLVPALLSIPVWLGVRRSVTIPNTQTEPEALRFSKLHLLTIAALVAVMFWLTIMGRMILTNIFAGGDETTIVALDTLLTWIPPAFCFLLYGVISDKGHDRAGFICGMGLSLAGIMLALLPGDAQGAVLLPLIFAFCFGEMYVEFFAYSVPLAFLINAKRPVFVASVGCVFYLIVSALEWKKDVWLPKIFMEIGTPLLVSAAISAVVFIILVYFLFERYREKTLAAALYALLHSGVSGETLPTDKVETAAASEQQNVMYELLTPEEINVALLLIEGETQNGISRKLHRSAADINRQLNTIRDKVIRTGDPNPGIAAAIVEFKLTRRETDMLRCLCRSMTNAEIAAELFLSEGTVKIHVRNLLKKLPAGNRQNVAAWVQSFGEKKE